MPKSIALVGEAYGQQEELTGLPFIGQSGQELTRMLDEAGISRRDCFITNTFNFRPPDNKILALCGTRSDVGPSYQFPPLQQGKYIRPEFLPEISRLREEIEREQPNLVVALGGTACWALLRTSKISSIRGVVAHGELVPGVKVLPTFHPSAILHNWSLRPIAVADLMKAKREAEFPGINRPERRAIINPTLEEIASWLAANANAPFLAVDIETGNNQIKCIGFAASRSSAIVVPFVALTHPSGCYWPTLSDELKAWALVNQILSLPGAKVFQNGLYDLQYIIRKGIKPRNCFHDTMLLHHALYPEMQKSLGFMGSIYTNEGSWKLMRKREKEQTKRDDE